MQKNIFFKNKFFIFILLCLFCFCGFFLFFNHKKASEIINYSDFYKYVEQNSVNYAEISGEKIFFILNDGKKYETQNSKSPTLKEFLLLHNVKVKELSSGTEIFSVIFDVIFYTFFFGVIIVAFRKFISPNTFKVVHKTGVKFCDIVGMENLKRDMVQIVQMMQNPTEYKKRQ